ncbi:hypothetical protein CAPTEDRAFT_160180 [Capitella teleta]|uniref:Inosine/uridine-preferring nucleoside hydrolase domain-containing protein n=1 Tax=Capitella teleta TaxID=283909 RepID=R7THY9_CAPTE|nr:hypothetical protein CAPTEDRAFT_160180 [Capitella teleta]|eukprot:ELT91171.1 hypothetical protein CAPTEDRAFT_160180 [Capitella teleta]
MAQRKRLVVDCDPGTDDAHAIMMALGNDDVDLVAITTVFGNTNVEQCTQNALRVLRLCDRSEVPVYQGCPVSLLGNPSPSSGFHGKDGMGDVQKEPGGALPSAQKEHAANALLRLAKEFTGELTLVAIGPLTNIALAIQLDPLLHEKIPHLIVMGGNTTGRGNITSTAEFNFYSDPEAAAFVFRCFKGRISLFPLELCQHYAPTTEFNGRVHSLNNPKAAFLTAMFVDVYLDEPSLVVPRFVMYDQAAVAMAISSKIAIETMSVNATVEVTGGKTRGQMVVDWNARNGHPPNVELVTKIDMDLVEALMLAAAN